MKISVAVTPKIHRGFTLVELIVTLAIAIVLIGIAVPSFSNFMQQIRLTSSTNELYSAISLTKAEAIKRNGKIDLVAIDGHWKNGWVIRNNDNEQIMAHEPLHDDITVSAAFTDGTQHIAFNGTGRSRTNSGSYSPQSGHIHLAIGDISRLIVVNFLGNIRVCNPAVDKSCDISSAD